MKASFRAMTPNRVNSLGGSTISANQMAFLLFPLTVSSVPLANSVKALLSYNIDGVIHGSGGLKYASADY